jgi:DNA-binding SARP family transcriptional activator/WD40 repeat protein
MIRVLGPLRVSHENQVWTPGGPKERRILAMLAVRLGEVVSADTLAETLWDGSPPKRPIKSVQIYVARLRAALDPQRAGYRVIETAPRGYRLTLDRTDLDATTFVDLVGQARAAFDGGDLEQADTGLAEAQALWAGEAYAEFTDSSYFAGEASRLSEVRLGALELRLAVGLAQGRHAEVVAEAEALCTEYPLREGLWTHLVTALYRCGRQADALAALRRLRTLLAEEIGADPSPDLRELEQRVLRQDPELRAPRPLRGAPPLPPQLVVSGPPFVGRAELLSWLQRTWSAAVRDGAGRVVAIGGPAGSGRTRLLGEFAAAVHADGVAVHADEPGSGLVILDDLDESRLARLRAITENAPLLCVVAFDDTRASSGLLDALDEIGAERRTLSPLSRDEVARLVAEMVGTVDAELVAQVADASKGWPGAAEQVTRRLIGERSAHRVVAAAAQARPARRSLAAARVEVAAGVRALTRVRARGGEAVPADGFACPYKGLASYEPTDASLFYGREDLIAALCARLVDTPFVAVIGPSGAGKSSLVRAGLLPAIADGVLPFLADATQWTLTPGGPLPEPDGPAVVTIDQFEEIFVAVEESAREQYLDELTALASRPDVRVIVVLRGDFVGACANHRRLAQLISDGTVLVGPMRADEIRRTIDLPARQVGLRTEPALVDAIVSDMEGQPGALPLLSTTLVEVWQRRAGSTLTASAYDRSGRVSGAVARLGEAAYASLDVPTRDAARRLLLRLAESDESGTMVRRRVPRHELGDDPATARALAVLVGRRLLTAGERGVEVTHEAVLTYWPRLAGWLADDEQGRTLRRHLAPAAVDWDTAGRPETDLYRGARLAGALDWAGERLVDLTAVERDFLLASRDLSDRELREEIARADSQARGRRRLRAALAAALCLLVVATGAAIFAVNRQLAASEASRQSLARRLGALALVTQDLDRALLLAVQAVRTYDERETRGDLLAVLSRGSQALHQARGPSDKGIIAQLALSPDGSTVVAVAGGGGRVMTWDAATLTPTGEPATVGQAARSVIAGPDPHGVFISAAIAVDTGEQGIVYWDAVERREIATYPLPAGVIGSSRRAAVTADNRILAVPTLRRSLLLFEIGTGRLLGQVEFPEPPGDVWRLGSLLVTVPINGSTAYIVDPVAPRLVGTVPLPVSGNAVASPDGQALLVVSGARAGLVAANDGHLIGDFAGATRAATVAAFSNDGSIVAVGGDDGLIGVWDAATGDIRDVLHGHAAPINGLTFAADGRTLYSAASDNSVIAWDVAGDRSFGARPSRAAVLPPATTTTTGLTSILYPLVGWSADRRITYVDAHDGSGAALIDVATGRAIRTTTPYALDPSGGAPVADVDRETIFAATGDGVLERHDLASATVVTASSAEPPFTRYMVAPSADGSVLAASVENFEAADSTEHFVEIIDAQTLEVQRRVGPMQYASFNVWLNGDGSLLLAASEVPGHHLELWDTRSGERLWISDVGEDQGVTMAASPDGRSVVMGTLRGAAVTVDLATGAVLARLGQRLSARIVSAAYSPDGTLLALSGDDGQAHLFDAATLREISPLPTGSGGRWVFVAFDADGSRLSAVDERGRVVRWDVRPQAWLDRACSIVGRDFTQAEWDTYQPGAAYEHTCGPLST